MKKLTTIEIAKFFHVTVNTVIRWIKTGKIKAAKEGNKWVVSQEDFDNLFETKQEKVQ